jgi:SLT domain-containing protein
MSDRLNIKEVLGRKAPQYAKRIFPPRENMTNDSFQKQVIDPTVQRAQKDFNVVNKKTFNDQVAPEKRGLPEKENDAPTDHLTSR